MTPSKQGHSLERFQAPMRLYPNNVVPGTGVDLKSAAATAIGNFVIPDAWGAVTVLAIGHEYVAAGGAQTTAGTWKLQIAATDVDDADGNAFVVASTASHGLYDTDETELNAITSQYEEAPAYPTLTAGQACQAIVVTQGVGAGSQYVYPYLIVRQKPNPGVS